MEKYYVDSSKIHGLRVHAITEIKTKELIGHICTAINVEKSSISDVLDSFKTEIVR